MKPNTPNHNLPDFDRDLESDAVWSLLEDAAPRDPSPRFVQDTLRRVRLDHEASSVQRSPWWRSLLAPKPLLLGAAGSAVALVALVFSLNSEPAAPVEVVETVPPTQWSEELDDALATALLSDASKDPSLFSDQELIGLLY